MAVVNLPKMRIKRYISKGTSIDSLTEEQIKQIEHRLNSTPRRCIDYLTPYEKMEQLIQGLTQKQVVHFWCECTYWHHQIVLPYKI